MYEGHRVQTSAHFSLLGFHGFLSLYGSFSCVLPRPTGVLFTELHASFLTPPRGNGFTVFVKCSRITAY